MIGGGAVLSRARRFSQEHGGKRCFAALTGQDERAWAAFVLLVELYCSADAAGRNAAIAAMAASLAAAQRSQAVQRTFVLAIAAIADWTDVAHLWPRLDGIPGVEVEVHEAWRARLRGLEAAAQGGAQ